MNVAAEIRSTKARLKEITHYIEDLDESLAALKLQAEEAAILEEQAAAALDEATSPSVSPFLAARDDLHRRREQVLRLIDQAESTARLQEGLAKRAAAVERHEAQIARLKEELAQLGDATYDRDRIIGSAGATATSCVSGATPSSASPSSSPTSHRSSAGSPTRRRPLAPARC
ncbi:hypothetical protein [Streptomyces sp. NPDC050564]|uniref:hypothetical protein n=1 Tax=Streptomyces sp. NPDC050564 TaxID=3365631 RepID=UPI0037930861